MSDPAEKPKPAPADLGARKATAEEQEELARAYARTEAEVRRLVASRGEGVQESVREAARLELARLVEEAQRARIALRKLEEQNATVRENGGSMGPPFWEAFGKAYQTVRDAERAVSRAREKAR